MIIYKFYVLVVNLIITWFLLICWSGTALGTGSQTIRVAPPGSTIIRAASGAHTLTPGSKQIITVHKAAGVAQSSGSGQPQIVTLVKTSQGMTVATVCIYRNSYELSSNITLKCNEFGKCHVTRMSFIKGLY